MRAKVLWVMALVVLAVVNVAIWQKEKVLAEGQTVLLELVPRDPRSLMQGDYMVLNYRLAEAIRAKVSDRSIDGLTVVSLDKQGRAAFDGMHQTGKALADGQALIRFRKRGDVVRIGAEAFFFEEGQAGAYASAKYGELKVSRDGEVVLTGMRDETLSPLGARLHGR